MQALKLTALTLTLAVSPLVWADNHRHDHAHAEPSAAATPALADGEIRKIDPETGKVTLKHGQISTLNMPPMTMVFTVSDKALLNGLKVGDKVRFAAAEEGGRFVVTQLEAAD